MELGLKFGQARTKSFEKDRDMNKEFKEVTILDAPSDFISFSNENGEVKGYLIDFEKLPDKPNYGTDSIDGDTVTFGVDDVFVYDRDGTVYYVKGYYYDGTFYYTPSVKK